MRVRGLSGSVLRSSDILDTLVSRVSRAPAMRVRSLAPPRHQWISDVFFVLLDFSLLLSLRLAPPDSVGRGLSVVAGLPQG